MAQKSEFKHVAYLWDDLQAEKLSAVDRLVYRSNLLGQDLRITNTGGGNTSTKLVGYDPLTNEPVDVLWIKGSGGDLRTADRSNFASLYQAKLLALQNLYAKKSNRGPKTPAEDEMVAAYKHCVFNLNPRAPSIDTPLHGFVPHSHVDHTHPVACIALATAKEGPALTREVYGDEVIWVDWQRPGFELGLQLQEICKANPSVKGVLLGGHGLINWAADDKACYELSLSLAERAAEFLEERGSTTYAFGGLRSAEISSQERIATLTSILPWLRGRLSHLGRLIATVDDDPSILSFVDSLDAPRLAELGTSCPDHFLRTKIKPLYVDWDSREGDLDQLKADLEEGLKQYTADYAAYYQAHKRTDSPPMRPAVPTVILIPGLGMIAWGKTKSESRVTAEFYKAAVLVMQGAETVSEYTALPRQEAFDIEYWQLEEAKLRRMPPEKPMSRQIVAVIGAGSGIGREVTGRLVGAGAVVAAMDLAHEAATKTADAVLARIGTGIGTGGSGIAKCGDVIGLSCDLMDRQSVREAFATVILAYGGLDHLVITAGLYPGQDDKGVVPDSAWDQTFAVNVKGPHIAASEAMAIWEAQGLRGSLVVASSVNAVVPKSGSLAYDCSKSALNHLIRELAVTLAPNIRVNGVAPATVIEGSSMFARSRVIDSLKKYGLPCDDSEDSQTLQDRLAAFYAQRTLTKQQVTAHDQAEAIYLLTSNQLAKTTGQILTVDGGLKDAFLR